MCHQNGCVQLSEAIVAEESLLVYRKPVELYRILHRRAQSNPSFLRRCLRYKLKAKRKRRLRAGIVIFNYRDYNNKLQRTEVTEDFSCPFCLMQCITFKGLRYHLCSSHDLFSFEFLVVTEEYQRVNVSVQIDRFVPETIEERMEQRQQSFFFCSKARRRKTRCHDQNEKQVCVQFLAMDSPKLHVEDLNKGILRRDDGEKASKSSSSEKDLKSRPGAESCGPECLSATELMEHVASTFSILGVSITQAQVSVDPECPKSQSGNEHAMHNAKTRKLAAERSDPRHRVQLQKRQFYHSHRVQPMALEQVMSDRNSEDEVDDDIADFEDRRMLDDFVDVSKDEKQLMHLWNSFVRKQRVLADGHVPWTCEAFSKLHGPELVASPALFWCWRLFMIKLWNHGLLDASTMNNCNIVLERCRNEGSDATKSGKGGDDTNQ